MYVCVCVTVCGEYTSEVIIISSTLLVYGMLTLTLHLSPSLSVSSARSTRTTNYTITGAVICESVSWYTHHWWHETIMCTANFNFMASW